MDTGGSTHKILAYRFMCSAIRRSVPKLSHRVLAIHTRQGLSVSTSYSEYYFVEAMIDSQPLLAIAAPVGIVG